MALSGFDLGLAATAFVVVAPVELPDKTFVATLVLATRYPALPVWLGVGAAFCVQCAVAVVAGQLLTLLPDRPVGLAAALLFAAGAVVLLRGARSADDEGGGAADGSRPGTPAVGGVRAALTSFAVLFTAEWGDLSQLLTAGLVARHGSPLSVFAGSWLALLAVSGLAVVAGRAVLSRVRLSAVRRVAAGVCAVLAVVTAVGALRG